MGATAVEGRYDQNAAQEEISLRLQQVQRDRPYITYLESARENSRKPL